MQKKHTAEQIANRKCPLCGEGHKKRKKWIFTPNRFLPSHLEDGIAVCVKHYQQAHGAWRYEAKIKGNEEYRSRRRKRDKKRYAEDTAYRNKILAKRKTERQLHEVEIKDRKTKYAKTEKGKIANRVRNKRHYAKDPTKQKERIKRLAETPKRQYTYIKRRAKRSNIPFEMNYDEFVSIRSVGICHYCKEELSKTAPSIDRLDSSKGYSTTNCVPCCISCNLVKGDRITPEEMIMFHEVLKGNTAQPPTDKHILYSILNKTSLKKRWGRLRYRSRKENIPLSLTFEQYKDIVAQPCAYCGVENASTGYGVDKIIPDDTIGYTLENSVSCCPFCNQTKSNILTYEKMQLLISIIAFFRKEAKPILS